MTGHRKTLAPLLGFAVAVGAGFLAGTQASEAPPMLEPLQFEAVGTAKACAPLTESLSHGSRMRPGQGRLVRARALRDVPGADPVR